jgi:hypothetical protein
MELRHESSNRNVSYRNDRRYDMLITWMGKDYTDAPSYYREVVTRMPLEDGVILGAGTHVDALAKLALGGLYVLDPDSVDIYVGRWRVNGRHLTHKHPEFGTVKTGWTTGLVECGLHEDECDLCGEEIPGEIAMMHHFYRLDG